MLRALIVAAALLATPATAQVSYPPPSPTVLGTYTVNTLPPCGANTQGRYAFVADLGGGPDTVLCDGTFWKHIRLGAPAALTATSGTITITPLTTAPVLLITNNVTTMMLQIDPAGLYPGYIMYVRTTGLVTGTLGVKVGSGGTALPILGNSTSLFIYDGTTLQRIQ